MPESDSRGTVYLEDLEIGMKRSLRKTISDADIRAFADISSDHNPLHLDDAYAKGTVFHGRIAHGILTAGLISAVIGERLPGHGTIYISQTLKFLAPVRPGDTVVAEVEVDEINLAKRRVQLKTAASVGRTLVLVGEADVLAPSRMQR